METRIIRDVYYDIVYIPQVKKSFLGLHYWSGITDKASFSGSCVMFNSIEGAKKFLEEYTKGEVVED